MKIIVATLLAAIGLLAAVHVTEQQLRDAQNDSATWLTYGKNYFGWRYSGLAEINASNVTRLAPRWIHQTGEGGSHETTPLVFGGMMFATGPSNTADALDLLTGKPLWRYQKTPPEGLGQCCGQPNRGFAALGDRLFKVNIEATLVAFDARSGAVLWEKPLASHKEGYTATGAPLIVKNKVVVGMAGAEFGTRGFIDAYDSNTGARLWRFHTVAGEGEPGGDTWDGDSWQRGGGSTWITGTYDPELNLIYWGIGNPGPGMDGSVRSGDNLYTCSIVALDADTGKLKWYFQATPHDTHDWDAVADPVLVDLAINGKPVKALVQADRNGYFYALDRTNGKLLHAAAYMKINWSTGLDSNGRPQLVPNMEPTEEGVKICPAVGGGHNWSATSYSPQTGLFYFSSTIGCSMIYLHKQQFHQGQWYQASTDAAIPSEPPSGRIIAIDPATAKIRWTFDMVTPSPAGMLATAGGLVFTGDGEGYLVALDARSGKPLWHFRTGGAIIAPPVTYTLNGRQQIAIAAGTSIITFALVN